MDELEQEFKMLEDAIVEDSVLYEALMKIKLRLIGYEQEIEFLYEQDAGEDI